MSQIVDDLRQVAIEIKTETQVGGNTAARVGGAFERVADALEGTQQIEDMDAAVAAVQQAAQENEQTIQDIVNNLAVVQTTGQSTSSVMSQKAVTDELNKQNKVGAYIKDDVRLLSIGQTYQYNEPVKTSAGDLVRVVKDIKAMNTTDAVATGDLKTYSNATFKALKPISAYNGSINYSSGNYALGRPSVSTISVDVSALTQSGNIDIAIGGVSASIAVATTDTAITIAAAIVTALNKGITGWTIVDNLDGTITITCDSAGANTLSFSFADTDSTGVVVSASNVAGATTTSVYDGTSWSDASTATMSADTSLYQSVDAATLASTYTAQNSVTQDINRVVDADKDYVLYGEYDATNTSVPNYGRSVKKCVWKWGDDVFFACGANYLYVYRNNKLIYYFTTNITTIDLAMGFVGYKNMVYWATASRSNKTVTWRLHSVNVLTGSRTNYTDTIVETINVASNSYNPKINFCALGDTLYASPYYALGYESYLKLYKVTPTGFSSAINTIFTAGEEWGKRIPSTYTPYQSIETGNLAAAYLSTDGNNLYFAVNSDRSGHPFIKKLVGNTWEKVTITNLKFTIGEEGDLVITPKGNIFLASPTIILTNIDVTCQHAQQINLRYILSVASAYTSIASCKFFWLDDALYVATTVSGGKYWRVVKVKKDYIDSLMEGKYDKEIIGMSQIPTLKNGECSLLISGNTTLTDWVGEVNYYVGRNKSNYIKIGKESIGRLYYRGVSNRYKYVPLSYGSEMFSTTPFRSIAYYNPFFSGGFRIPCVDFYNNKFYAMCSARYFTGGDYEPAEGVICKSLDGGHEWKDYKKAMPIINGTSNADSRSCMDSVFLIDKYASSPHVGRIWCFARDDNSNFVSSKQNLDYVRFVANYSDDDGLTWSTPTDITDSILPSDYSTVKLVVTGCSAGITLANGTLVLPIYLTYTTGAYVPRAGFIYSINNGTTWQLGDVTSVYSDESVIIQKEDGTLVMMSRTAHNSQLLFSSLSSIGSGWQTINGTSFISQECCNGFGYCNGVYVLSTPAVWKRNNITLYASRDLANWKKIVQLTTSTGTGSQYGYSQLVFNQNTLGVLLENRNKDIEFFNLKEYLPSVFGC